jgi:hypothetical protein
MALQAYRHARSGLPGTAALERDLLEVRYLLKALSSAPADDAEVSGDIDWLRDHERFLRSVLASRLALRQRKVVDFADWRGGELSSSSALEHVA